MFSQELLTNGELNHFSLKERMVEIGKRWHKLSPSQKEKYKKLVEEQQVEYKVELEAWVKVRLCRPLMAADRIIIRRKRLPRAAVDLTRSCLVPGFVPTGPSRLQGVLLLSESLSVSTRLKTRPHPVSIQL